MFTPHKYIKAGCWLLTCIRKKKKNSVWKKKKKNKQKSNKKKKEQRPGAEPKRRSFSSSLFPGATLPSLPPYTARYVSKNRPTLSTSPSTRTRTRTQTLLHAKWVANGEIQRKGLYLFGFTLLSCYIRPTHKHSLKPKYNSLFVWSKRSLPSHA